MLINKSHVKKFALELSKTLRGGKFTRVGKSFLDSVEASLKATLQDKVYRHPSKGKTLL